MVNLWKRSMSITPTAGSARRRGRAAASGTRRRAGRRCCRRRWPASACDVYLFAISYSAAAMKSSKTFCFCSLVPGLVPVFAVLAAAAQVGHRVDAAHLHPDEIRDREAGRHRDVESAVAVEVASDCCRRASVPFL